MELAERNEGQEREMSVVPPTAPSPPKYAPHQKPALHTTQTPVHICPTEPLYDRAIPPQPNLINYLCEGDRRSEDGKRERGGQKPETEWATEVVPSDSVSCLSSVPAMEDWACARVEEGVLGPGRWSTMTGTQIGGKVPGKKVVTSQCSAPDTPRERRKPDSHRKSISRVWICY